MYIDIIYAKIILFSFINATNSASNDNLHFPHASVVAISKFVAVSLQSTHR